MGSHHHYDAHDTEIISDFPLPELISACRKTCFPITILEGGNLPLPMQAGEQRWVDSSGFQVAWGQVATFHVDPAGHIHYRRVPEASDELIRVPLLGSVLAVALHYRDTFVMHGNAMSVHGKGIILSGSKGQGKSTLSAALVAQGHLVHAEDAASLSIRPGSSVDLLRGTRQLRLWRDSIEQSFGVSPPSRQIHELSDKRVVPLADQPETPSRVPLERIYFLEDADEITLEPLGATEAWPLVLVHALVSRFGTELLRGQDAARHFAACAELAKRVRCVRLRRPRDYSRLGEVVTRIEDDLLQA